MSSDIIFQRYFKCVYWGTPKNITFDKNPVARSLRSVFANLLSPFWLHTDKFTGTL